MEEKDRFYQQLYEKYNWRGKNSINEDEEDDEERFSKDLKSSRFMMSRQYIERLLSTLKNPPNAPLKSPKDYYVLKNFRMENISGVERLVKKNSSKYFVPVEDVWDEINTSHTNCGHGGEKRTSYDIRKSRGIMNIPLHIIKLFIAKCSSCLKKKISKGPRVINSILTNDFLERAQVDLIDMNSVKSIKNFRYILVFQDHLTKFVILKPLINKDVSSVVSILTEIFTTIGCPKILQSDNGREFNFNTELTNIWPDIKIIKGRPRNPQSQGSVERANQDIEQMIRCYFEKNPDVDWSTALPLIQLQKNNALNRTIGVSPYFAVFGQHLKCSIGNEFTVGEISSCYDPEESFQEEMADDVNETIDEEMMMEEEEEVGRIHHVDENETGECVENNNNINIMDDYQTTTSSSSSSSTAYSCEQRENINIPSSSPPPPPPPSFQENSRRIIDIRNQVSSRMKRAADKLGEKTTTARDGTTSGDSTTNGTLKFFNEGDIVLIRIPKEDKIHKFCFNNILAQVVMYFPDIDKYKVKSMESNIVIKHFFSQSLLTPVDMSPSVRLQSISQIELPLRCIIRKEMGSFKCSCRSICRTLKCPCKKNKRLCRNGVCHAGKLNTDCTNNLNNNNNDE